MFLFGVFGSGNKELEQNIRAQFGHVWDMFGTCSKLFLQLGPDDRNQATGRSQSGDRDWAVGDPAIFPTNSVLNYNAWHTRYSRSSRVSLYSRTSFSGSIYLQCRCCVSGTRPDHAPSAVSCDRFFVDRLCCRGPTDLSTSSRQHATRNSVVRRCRRISRIVHLRFQR